eukprot:13501638-Alexandrium_andersonii.AAC.1
MSASLVGSEMCIRDRLPTFSSSFLPVLYRGATAPPDPPRKRLRRAPDAPVSYTHLTLPTICSV